MSVNKFGHGEKYARYRPKNRVIITPQYNLLDYVIGTLLLIEKIIFNPITLGLIFFIVLWFILIYSGGY